MFHFECDENQFKCFDTSSVRTVHERMDWTDSVILRHLYQPIQYPIQYR